MPSCSALSRGNPSRAGLCSSSLLSLGAADPAGITTLTPEFREGRILSPTGRGQPEGRASPSGQPHIISGAGGVRWKRCSCTGTALGDFARVVDAAAASSPPPRAKGPAVLALLVQELLSQALIR